MANEGQKNNDLYAVLGLKKECTASELRNAYKKLALRWHPDRISASGNLKFVEESKKKFQAIQQAYSVLSDTNKRFLYDVGAYDSDEDESGMGDFLNEMVAMMDQVKSNGNGEGSFEELQELFEEMFQEDIEAFGSSSQASCSAASSSACNSSSKRSSSEMSCGNARAGSSFNFESRCQSFSMGVRHQDNVRKGKEVRGTGSSRRHGRKQKVSSGDDVSSDDFGV